MKYVYIAGPYTGNEGRNVRHAMAVASNLMASGLVPYVPHLSHFMDIVFPHDYEEWIAYDLEWLRVCDVLLRLPGESTGADRETKQAEEWGIPVYYSLQELMRVQRLSVET